MISQNVRYGRVVDNIHMRGYGFIISPEGEELFFSSYEINGQPRRHSPFRVGSIVTYIPTLHDGKKVATNVKLVERYPEGKDLLLPNGEILRLKRLRKFGISYGKHNIETLNLSEDELKEHGYSLRDLDYLYFNTSQGEYRFFNQDSKLVGDGNYDIYTIYNNLRERYYTFNDKSLEVLEA